MLFPSILKENTLFVEEKKQKMIKIRYLSANRKSKRKKKDVRPIILIPYRYNVTLVFNAGASPLVPASIIVT